MIVPITLATTNVDYWKQEHLILAYNGGGDKLHMWSSLSGSYASPIAKYTPDTNGNVFVDVTDYIRTYGGCSIFLKDEAADANTCTVVISVAGLINPWNVIVPYHYGNDYTRVQMPNRMIEPLAGYPLMAEFYYNGAGASFTGGATLSQDRRQITITGDFSYKPVPYGSGRNYNLVHRMCGIEYAYVRWVSFSGITRVHVFEISKPKTETADDYSMLPIDNEYIEIKGRKDGFTLRLDNLCAFDLWYYADVITSSKVEVSLDGIKYDRVQVATKNITLPDGETKVNGELAIEVNWKRYDAVTM